MYYLFITIKKNRKTKNLYSEFQAHKCSPTKPGKVTGSNLTNALKATGGSKKTNQKKKRVGG